MTRTADTTADLLFANHLPRKSLLASRDPRLPSLVPRPPEIAKRTQGPPPLYPTATRHRPASTYPLSCRSELPAANSRLHPFPVYAPQPPSLAPREAPNEPIVGYLHNPFPGKTIRAKTVDSLGRCLAPYDPRST